MTTSRRSFLSTSAALAASATLPPLAAAETAPDPPAGTPARDPGRGYEGWLEIDPAALRRNAAELGRRAGGRPILACIKNNGYGIGVVRAAAALEAAPEVVGFAVVKPDEAVELLDAGIRKPVLFLGHLALEDALELTARGVQLAPFADDTDTMLRELARRNGRPVPVHLKVDTGLGRLGVPHHRALPWMEKVARSGAAEVLGTFMTFTEDDEFDREQLARFRALGEEARRRGIPTGRLHAASSNAVLRFPEAHLDMVRPGLSLFGAFPSEVEPAARTGLTPAFRLRARASRVELLPPGESAGYGRNYVAREPTWIATLPVGHADGYPRGAVRGAEVLFGERTYRVVGAVGASHTIVEIGPERTVQPGDVATLIGPDHPAVHPNTVSERSGFSVYDVLMHLSARLPARTT
jgi:alanine racemase